MTAVVRKLDLPLQRDCLADLAFNMPTLATAVHHLPRMVCCLWYVLKWGAGQGQRAVHACASVADCSARALMSCPHLLCCLQRQCINPVAPEAAPQPAPPQLQLLQFGQCCQALQLCNSFCGPAAAPLQLAQSRELRNLLSQCSTARFALKAEVCERSQLGQATACCCPCKRAAEVCLLQVWAARCNSGDVSALDALKAARRQTQG